LNDYEIGDCDGEGVRGINKPKVPPLTLDANTLKDTNLNSNRQN
jgi:hypothetical protein